MTDFDDTKNWEKKNNSAIVYRYDHQGKPHEGKLEKEPHTLLVAVERLSVIDRTAWEFAEEERPDSVTGFLASEFIRAGGKLDLSRVHAFSIGEAATVTFDQIDVSIYPTTLEDLQATSKHERWTIVMANEERPENGWLQDERGRIDYYEADEYMVEPSLSARLLLDRATFDALVQKIKNGGTMRTARIEILADLFQFGYEGSFAPPTMTRNYGLLCGNEGRVTKGHTKARLEELMLEWAPTLAKPKSDDDPCDYLPLDATNEDTVAHAVNLVASDVKGIRARVDAFYQAAIVVAVIVVLGRVLDWLSA